MSEPIKVAIVDVRWWHFNMNDYFWVKLTEFGRQLHRASYDAIREEWIEEYPFPYEPIKEDAEGWSRWRLWELMKLYGPHLTTGENIPFETTVKIEVKTGSKE